MRNFILFLASLTLLTSCNTRGNERWISSQGAIWNTLYKVTYHAGTDLSDSIISTLHEVEMSLSPFQPQSLISRINRSETDSADRHLARVFLTSQHINALSGGMFDPTVAPLVNYWGFGYDSASTAPLDSIMARVGIDQCSLTDMTIHKKHPLTEFNFSAITKGYGCDAVGNMLKRNGCGDFLVEIGGEIAAGGLSPHGKQWRIMVDAPHESNDRIIHDGMMTISATDCGIATSGNYRNYRITDAGKLSHTISPVTGRPVTLDAQTDTTVLSATVIAKTAMEADALATASMLLTPEAAASMARSAGASRLILAVTTATDSLLIIDSEF